MIKVVLLVLLACFLPLHVEAVSLAFHAHGYTPTGWAVGALTLALPVVADVGWGFYAFSIGHPYLKRLLIFLTVCITAFSVDVVQTAFRIKP